MSFFRGRKLLRNKNLEPHPQNMRQEKPLAAKPI